ncbi:MAG: hypothetical protein PUB60_02730 [Veillonellaceae bacterium]|nr:hypothetical protein [Veillonellaceae bacterium]
MSKMKEFLEVLEKDVTGVNLNETAKQELTQKLVEDVMPIVEAWVDKLSATLMAEAKAESGWNKIRDEIVLPYSLRALVYLIRLVLRSTMENTVKA